MRAVSITFDGEVPLDFAGAAIEYIRKIETNYAKNPSFYPQTNLAVKDYLPSNQVGKVYITEFSYDLLEKSYGFKNDGLVDFATMVITQS